MNHRTIFVAVLAVVMSPLLLVAEPQQGPPDFDRGWRSETRGEGQSRRTERMIEFLELSDAQTLQIETILDEQRKSRQTALGAIRSANEELQALLDSESPDVERVGAKVIELHAMRKAMRAQGASDHDKIRDLLTPEQAEKLDTMMEVREMGRGDRDRKGRGGHRDQRPGPPISDG